MSAAVLGRGTQRDHRARHGRQAPLSGRQGALLEKPKGHFIVRPVDTIADARKVAEETV